VHPSLDLRQFRYFVAIVEEGQITRASARLHVAQPALSQAIAKLEASVGVRLLERQSRGVVPTAAGAAFFEKARATLLAAEEAQAVLGPWLRADRQLILGFLPSLQPLARPILRRFMEEQPDVEIQTRHLGVSRRLLELKRGGVDAELLFPRPAEPDLVVASVAHASRYVLLSEAHPLAGRSALAFEEIEGETFPGLHPSVPERWAREAWLTDRRGAKPRVTSETPITLDEVWALISTGKAIAVLPEFMVLPTQGDGVRAIPLVDVEPVEVCLARRKDDTRETVSAMFQIVEGRASSGAAAPSGVAAAPRHASARARATASRRS
jgi:DNA-binding transcriptional LysR family regulator